jgi:hypothetical protein
MSLFREEGGLSAEKGGRQIKATGGKDKLPETPDFAAWGAAPRKGSPFLLDSFSSNSESNISKP